MAKQRVDDDLKIIGVIERHVAHDQPVDDAKGMIGNKQHGTVFWNISKRAGIAVKRNVGELEGLAEKGFGVDVHRLKALIMRFHFMAA